MTFHSSYKMPINITYLYANKLYLFLVYTLIYLLMEQSIVLGSLCQLLVVFGHAHFLKTTLKA
jgi:hypothetical protein